MIRNMLQAVMFEWRQEGWRNTLKMWLEMFIQFRQVYIFRQSLLRVIPAPESQRGIRVRQSTLADQDLWQTLVPAYRAQRFAQKMRAGEVCFLAIKDDRAIGVFWAAFTHCPSVQQIPIEITPNEAYLWGAYVRAEHRSQGVATALALNLAQWLKEHGYEKTIQLTEQSNFHAVKMALRSGNTLTGRYTVFKILKWRWLRSQPITVSASIQSNSIRG